MSFRSMVQPPDGGKFLRMAVFMVQPRASDCDIGQTCLRSIFRVGHRCPMGSDDACAENAWLRR